MPQKFYITTAIAYTSRKPHIGNSYEIVLTDAIARFKRMAGFDVFFLTGTDEHGQKIETCAKEAGVSPKAYVDEIAGEIRRICDLLGASYDKFIRTTDDYHERAVQKIFKKLYEQGDIYKDKYEGLYCVPCESFFTESQLADGKCPDCGREVSPQAEEAYFMRLGKYQERLERYIEENPGFIYPESRKREMVNNFLKPGLQDLCVSRTSFTWGVPVDFDEGHIVYVWIDALSNYITALAYSPDSESELFNRYWPADAHVIGKDILRFHTIYWPILLMALGEKLPRKVFGHPWMLFGEDKMSKSKGNVIYADDVVDVLGRDAVRWYLLAEMPHAQDGSITLERVVERYNADLANVLGNLVQRSISMVGKYFGGVLPAPEETLLPQDAELEETALAVLPALKNAIDSFRLADACETVLNLAKRANKYVDETAPWVLAKDEALCGRLGTVLYHLIETCRFLGVLLEPFMPSTAAEILRQINAGASGLDSLSTFGGMAPGTQLNEPAALFARLKAEETLERLRQN
jgi:methionyl-tRNA synthetase